MNTDSTTKLLEDIDAYVEGLFAPPDEVLEAALRESRRAGLPEINVSPNGGRLLQLFAELVGARRILEIGTLGGYSAIHFARVLPEDGTLISLELEERHAEVARANVERAGLAHKVEVQVGDARELLAALAENDAGPFDLIFIDADKSSPTTPSEAGACSTHRTARRGPRGSSTSGWPGTPDSRVSCCP